MITSLNLNNDNIIMLYLINFMDCLRNIQIFDNLRSLNYNGLKSDKLKSNLYKGSFYRLQLPTRYKAI